MAVGSDYVASLQATGQSTAAVSPVSQNSPAVSSADMTSSINNPTQAMNQAQSNIDGSVINLLEDTPPYWFQLNLANYSRSGWNSVGTFDTTTQIILPMPMNMIDNHQVQYESLKVGTAGALGFGAVGLFNNGIPSSSQIASAYNSATSKSNLQSVGGAGAVAVGNQINKNFVDGALAASGVAINSYGVLSLIGPELKSYSFRWEFAPRTPDESTALQQFKTTISDAMAPSLSSGASCFWGYPSMAQCSYQGPNGIDMGATLYRMKPSVITRSVFDFAPHGQPSFFTNSSAPTCVQVTIEFTELEYWVSGDFSNSNGLNVI